MKPGVVAAIIAALALVAVVWQASDARRLAKENAELRAQLAALGEQAASAAAVPSQQDAPRNDVELRELARLRGELAQLRTATNDAAKLRAENERLLREIAKPAAPAAATGNNPAAAPSGDTFTRDSWSNAGYATPESALVTAIWAMKEGDPRTYLASLAPEEHARITKAWENKSEAEIAAKHRADVSNITSIRMIDRQEVSPDQMTIGVYIDGVGRFEKVSMQRVGNDWKFKGFIRDPQP